MIAEAYLAEQMGLSRDRLRELRREAPERIDFPREGNRISWNAEGVEWLRKKLAADGAKAENARIRPVFVRISRIFERKHQWMLGVEKISGRAVRVHVRNNALFVPGMELPCLPAPEWPGILRYYGPAPRHRGKLHPKTIERYLEKLGVTR